MLGAGGQGRDMPQQMGLKGQVGRELFWGENKSLFLVAQDVFDTWEFEKM